MDKRVFLRGLSALGIGLIAISGVVLTPSAASAATTIVVSNNHDSGAGSLRQAFVDASTGGAHQGVDVAITIPASVSDITLTTGELQYDGGSGGTHAMTVTGNGQTISTSAGAIDVETSGTFTVADVSLAVAGGGGDGIFAVGPVVADNISITGANNGIRDTSATAAVTMSNAQITGSEAFGVTANGDITLVRSTVADSAGYGINSNHGVATLTNSTVTGNATTGTFSGIWALNVELKYSTVVSNGANAGDQDVFAQVDLTSSGSVVGLEGAGNACHVSGTTISLGYNLSDDPSCNFTGTGDRQGASHNPMLAALAANGGPTDTRAPSAGSPLIDAIPSAACIAGITTDQRGVTRPQGNACDIGAVEIAAAPVATTTTTTTTTTPAQPVPTPTSVPAATLPRTGGNTGAGSLIALALILLGGTLLLAGRAVRRSTH